MNYEVCILVCTKKPTIYIEYNIQLTGICDDFDTIYERGVKLDDGLIFFFVKNDLIDKIISDIIMYLNS